MLLVSSNKFNQEHFPDLGSDVSSYSTDFLRSFLGRHFAGKLASGGVPRKGGVLLVIFGGVVPPGSPNPDPISDQKLHSSHPFSDLASIHTHS